MSNLYRTVADMHPSLKRGIVWCTVCGNKHRVNSAYALQTGWPLCCGYTMTIDSPEEREAFNRAAPKDSAE